MGSRFVTLRTEVVVVAHRVTSAFARLLDLPAVWMRSVVFEPDRVLVGVARRGRRLAWRLRHRESRQHPDSVWRHLDLGSGGWRSALGCGGCDVPSTGRWCRASRSPDGARFTRDFEQLVA
jgi:hypothetical protein